MRGELVIKEARDNFITTQTLPEPEFERVSPAVLWPVSDPAAHTRLAQLSTYYHNKTSLSGGQDALNRSDLYCEQLTPCEREGRDGSQWPPDSPLPAGESPPSEPGPQGDRQERGLPISRHSGRRYPRKSYWGWNTRNAASFNHHWHWQVNCWYKHTLKHMWWSGCGKMESFHIQVTPSLEPLTTPTGRTW